MQSQKRLWFFPLFLHHRIESVAPRFHSICSEFYIAHFILSRPRRIEAELLFYNDEKSSATKKWKADRASFLLSLECINGPELIWLHTVGAAAPLRSLDCTNEGDDVSLSKAARSCLFDDACTRMWQLIVKAIRFFVCRRAQKISSLPRDIILNAYFTIIQINISRPDL